MNKTVLKKIKEILMKKLLLLTNKCGLRMLEIRGQFFEKEIININPYVTYKYGWEKNSKVLKDQMLEDDTGMF